MTSVAVNHHSAASHRHDYPHGRRSGGSNGRTSHHGPTPAAAAAAAARDFLFPRVSDICETGHCPLEAQCRERAAVRAAAARRRRQLYESFPSANASAAEGLTVLRGEAIEFAIPFSTYDDESNHLYSDGSGAAAAGAVPPASVFERSARHPDALPSSYRVPNISHGGVRHPDSQLSAPVTGVVVVVTQRSDLHRSSRNNHHPPSAEGVAAPGRSTAGRVIDFIFAEA